MAFAKYFRKLMGWCPKKDSRKKERQEVFFSGFKLENGSQLVPSSTGLQDRRILKARASILSGWWVVTIIFLIFIASWLLWIYSPEGSFLILFSGLIMFLMPLVLLLNRPNTVAVISGKIMVKRSISKPVVIEKEDVTQISVTKNGNYSLRWLIRLCYIIIIPLLFVVMILNDLKDLERSALDYTELHFFLTQLSTITTLLVVLYYSELITPYKQILKIATRSSLKLEFYINEPEEILRILKNEE
jgi:hypothetical protein